MIVLSLSVSGFLAFDLLPFVDSGRVGVSLRFGFFFGDFPALLVARDFTEIFRFEEPLRERSRVRFCDRERDPCELLRSLEEPRRTFLFICIFLSLFVDLLPDE